MNKMDEILMELKRTLPTSEDGTPADLTYQVISDAMKRREVTTLDILNELEDCLNVHVAYNTNLYMHVGSPKNPHTAIPLETAANIASSYYYLLEAKEKILMQQARQREENWQAEWITMQEQRQQKEQQGVEEEQDG